MTLEEMRALGTSSRTIRFAVEGRSDFYQLVGRVLKNQRYGELDREQRGIVRQFLAKVTDRSRARITRLIGQWLQSRSIRAKLPKRRRFPRRYTPEDAARLAEVDTAARGLAGTRGETHSAAGT